MIATREFYYTDIARFFGAALFFVLRVFGTRPCFLCCAFSILLLRLRYRLQWPHYFSADIVHRLFAMLRAFLSADARNAHNEFRDIGAPALCNVADKNGSFCIFLPA